jgi:hypothetical protein
MFYNILRIFCRELLQHFFLFAFRNEKKIFSPNIFNEKQLECEDDQTKFSLKDNDYHDLLVQGKELYSILVKK